MIATAPRYRLTQNELALWLRFIEHQVGFVLPSSQVGWVKGVIERHLSLAQLSSTELLQVITQDTTRYHQLFDDILIPHTQFFRHLATFEFIVDYTQHWRQQIHVPEFTKTQPALTLPGFSAWSVGCSTGQETVSLAMTVSQALGAYEGFTVYGCDFHRQSLAQAQQGRYDIMEKAYIPTRYQDSVTEQDGKIQVVPELMSHLHYFSQNLVQYMQPIPIAKKQCQIIVCKNVLIYFRQFEQRDVINYLTEYLADDGVLLLGSGELPQFGNEQLSRVPIASINAFHHVNAPAWLKALWEQPRRD